MAVVNQYHPTRNHPIRHHPTWHAARNRSVRANWYRIRSQTRRGIRGGAILGSVAPLSALAVSRPTTAVAASIVVPLAAALGGWALYE